MQTEGRFSVKCAAVKHSYAIRGVLWAGFYILLVILPLGVLLLGKVPPGTAFGWDFAVALGFSALAIMFTMFFLTARFRRITRAFGIDIIYYFHRWIALVAFVLLLAHPIILVGMEPLLLEYLKPDAPWHMLAGNVALLAVILLVITSVWRKALCLHYDMWRFLHAVFAVLAVGLAMVHIAGVNYYVESPWKRELWQLLTASVVLVLLHVRIVRPLLIMRRGYRVVDVSTERGDACTLTVAPDGHAGLAFMPGQFVWLNIWHLPHAMREHPFSIASSALQPQRMQFTIKRLGDFTSTINEVEPGQRVYLDGPFGAFSIDRHPDAPGYVFVAGGIGIAPILSMLRTLADRGDQRPLWLFYAYRSLERLTACEELQTLQSRLRLTMVTVLNEPPPGWTGESGLITREILQHHLPGNHAALEYFLCGPTPMTASIERSLDAIGVPLRRVHTELFDMV
jgi:predicted ferric reductase